MLGPRTARGEHEKSESKSVDTPRGESHDNFHTPDTGGNASSSGPTKVETEGRKRKVHVGFDDSEAEDDFDQTLSACEEDGPSLSDIERDFENLSIAEGKKRRLNKKTSPGEVGYTMRPLLKRAEAQIKRHQYKVKLKKQQAALKAARAQAIALMAMQAPVAAFDIEERSEVGHFNLPHESHKIIALHGGGGTIYCKRCGYWSAKLKLKLLAEPCRGL